MEEGRTPGLDRAVRRHRVGRTIASARDHPDLAEVVAVSARFGITVPRAAHSDTALSKDALRLYLVLAPYADGLTRIARPGQDRLAEELGWISKSTGKPDRRRVYNAMDELVAAELVEFAGQHSLGKRRWVRMYRVAPFDKDADEGYASSDSQGDEAPKDAEPSHASSDESEGDFGASERDIEARMRTFSSKDAATTHAPSYQSLLDTSSSSHQFARIRSRNGEEQEEKEKEIERKRALGRSPEFARLLEEERQRKTRADAS
jgi:hypothetical protein